MTNYKINIDTKKFDNQLQEHKNKSKSIARRMMGKVASEIKKDSKKKLHGEVLQKRSGNLLKKFKFKTLPNYEAYINNNAYYASWHELGNDHLPARPFLLPTVDDYFNSSKAEEIMDKILQDALDKIYQKELEVKN